MQHAIITQLRQVLDQDAIIVTDEQKKLYETEWRGRYSNQCVAVLLPQTIAQIQHIVCLCNQHKISIIPQGGNTSLCAGSIPSPYENPQLIVNLRRLNQFIDVDTTNHSICLDAGCTLYQVQAAAAKHDLYFPLSIGSEGSCQIGGNIATNAGGVHVIKYGMMRDLVLGLEAILPNGTIINQLHNLRKNNTNFDLKQLFIGSEGTLGIITKAVLKLYPQPQNYITGLIGVSNLSIVIDLLNEFKPKFSLCAFEIINQTTQTIYDTHFPKQQLMLHNTWLILFELETYDSNSDIDNIVHILEQFQLEQVIIASNEKERQQLWQMRENIPLAEKMAGLAVKHDISLPISSIPDFITTNEINIRHQYPAAQIIIFGHLGDGNLHYNIKFDNLEHNELQKIEPQINQLVYTDLYNFHGSFSAEHGIGYIKKDLFHTYYDPISYQLALSIKQLIDPNNIFNPGKIFKDI